jgi:flagellar basal-body rod modification protein FlgD
MTAIGSSVALTPAQAAAQAAVGAALPGSALASTTGTASAVGNNALTQLGQNFNQFLSLLLTQLQNQDPTAPMDANSFTTELVQFTGVQQQVATNTSLTSLISMTQQSQVLQASQYVGHQATVTSTAIALQNGQGQITYTGTAGESVGIAIVNAAGGIIRSDTVTAQDGTNTWTWNGLDNAGNQVPDGAYRIGVEGSSGSAAPSAIPFDVVGTATGVTNTGTAGITVSLGALSVGLGSVQSVSTN